MNYTLRFIGTLLILLSATAVSVFPRSPSHRFSTNRFVGSPALLLAAASRPVLAKQHASPPADTMVLTRVDLYDWNSGDWKMSGVVTLFYDGLGRIVEWNEVPQGSDDTRFSSSVIEYLDGGKHMRETSSSYDSMDSTLHWDKHVDDYYIGSHEFYNSMFPTTYLTAMLALDRPVMPAVDSIRSTFFDWNSSTQTWDHHSRQMVSFTYDGTTMYTVTVFPSLGTSGSTDDSIFQRYDYLLGAGGIPDTIVNCTLDDAGECFNLMRMIHGYTDGRLTSVKIVSGLSSGTDESEFLSIDYLLDGRINSYTFNSFSGSGDSLNSSSQKMIFNYSKLSVAVRTAVPLSPGRPLISVGSAHDGCIRITTTAEVRITRVLRLDLQGRVVDRFRPQAVPTGAAIETPLRVRASSVNILRVTTDRGTFDMKINGAAVNRR
jgi:hypothetical protein